MSYATKLLDECKALAEALTTAGLPTTLSRTKLRVPGAWLRPDSCGPRTLSGAGEARVSLLLVTQPAGDEEALKDLAGQLELALSVVDPVEDVDTSVVLPHNNNMLPAFRLQLDLDL